MYTGLGYSIYHCMQSLEFSLKVTAFYELNSSIQNSFQNKFTHAEVQVLRFHAHLLKWTIFTTRTQAEMSCSKINCTVLCTICLHLFTWYLQLSKGKWYCIWSSLHTLKHKVWLTYNVKQLDTQTRLNLVCMVKGSQYIRQHWSNNKWIHIKP